MKKSLGILGVACLLVAFQTGRAWSWTEPMVAGHEAAALFNEVAADCIDQAKDMTFVTYGHTSHGSQIVTGMDVLMNLDARYSFFNDFEYYRYGDSNPVAPSGSLSFWDSVPDGDLGNPDRTTWAGLTDALLSNEGGVFAVYPHRRNLVMWSWCGQAGSATEEDITTYLSLMSDLETRYPDVVFIYMTGHLDGSGVDGNLNQRNEQIRAYCRANNKVLFDFADIESYDPDGNYFLDRSANDNCDYDGGNWATEWCAANSGSPLCTDCGGCAHSQCLNCNRKARAFWWLLAQLAGCGTVVPDTAETIVEGAEPSPDRAPDASSDTTTDMAGEPAPDAAGDPAGVEESGGGEGCGCSLVG
jgi:hypothetical protein